MKNRNKKAIQGVSAIIAASLLWAVAYLIRKRISAVLGPFTITFIEAFSGAILASVIYRIKPRDCLAAMRTGGWPAALMALLGVTVANSALVVGFKYVDLGIASILEKTQPIFTVVLGAIFLKEKLSRLSIGLGLLGIIGVVLVIPRMETSVGTHDMGPTWSMAIGVCAVILAAIAWAGAGVLGRMLAVKEMDPVKMSLVRATIGAMTALPLVLAFERPGDLTRLWPAYALASFNGFIDSVVCYVLYYYGMKYIAAGVTSIIEIITPVGAVLLGVVVLGEHLSLRQYSGAAVVLMAVTLLVWREIGNHAKSRQQEVAREFHP
jgi:drug/metabolite transporter (DMT)-like permease